MSNFFSIKNLLMILIISTCLHQTNLTISTLSHTTENNLEIATTDLKGNIITIGTGEIIQVEGGKRLNINNTFQKNPDLKCFQTDLEICLLSGEGNKVIVYSLSTNSMQYRKMNGISEKNILTTLSTIEKTNFFLAMPIINSLRIYRFETDVEGFQRVLSLPLDASQKNGGFTIANQVLAIPDSNFGCSSLSFLNEIQKIDFSKMEILGGIPEAKGFLAFLTAKLELGLMISVDIFDLKKIDFIDEKIITSHKLSFIATKIQNVEKSNFILIWDNRKIQIFDFSNQNKINEELTPTFHFKPTDTINGGFWNEFKSDLGFYSRQKIQKIEISNPNSELCHPNCNHCSRTLSRRFCHSCRKGTYLAKDNYCFNNNHSLLQNTPKKFENSLSNLSEIDPKAEEIQKKIAIFLLITTGISFACSICWTVIKACSRNRNKKSKTYSMMKKEKILKVIKPIKIQMKEEEKETGESVYTTGHTTSALMSPVRARERRRKRPRVERRMIELVGIEKVYDNNRKRNKVKPKFESLKGWSESRFKPRSSKYLREELKKSDLMDGKSSTKLNNL